MSSGELNLLTFNQLLVGALEEEYSFSTLSLYWFFPKRSSGATMKFFIEKSGFLDFRHTT